MSQQVKFFTFENYHQKKEVGSTRIRVHNLLKHWPEASIYKYGDKADVLVFQKVYVTMDYKLPINYPGIKILDICDPDWKDSPDIFIKETLDAMDAVVTSSEALADYLQQMTETPCRLIRDRYNLDELPRPKKHTARAKNVVWFGYSHNAMNLRSVIPILEQLDLGLIVISNENPVADKWATNPDFVKKYKFIKYEHPPYKNIQRGDICVFPEGGGNWFKFKSENKTVLSELLGVPVVKTPEDLEKMLDPEARNKHISQQHDKLKQEYDVRNSVREYKELIDEIRSNRR